MAALAITPGSYVHPLHGDNLPSVGLIKVEVKEAEGGYTLQAEVSKRDKRRVLLAGYAFGGQPQHPIRPRRRSI